MSEKIAIIVNDVNSLSTFEEGSNINIYEKNDTRWNLEEVVTYSLDTLVTLSHIRDYIRNIILKLKDCKILIGKSVLGLPYNIFDRMGFAIFEATTISDTLLDEVLSEVQASARSKISSNLSFLPVQTQTDGIYFMDLIELQEMHPDISSKKALQPFIDTTSFYKLEIICSHVPPWFDNFLPARKLTYNTEKLENNSFKVEIFNKICSC